MTDFVRKYHLENFPELQDKILMAIETTKENYDCHYSTMSFSDYKIPGPHLYRKLVKEAVEPHIKDYIHRWGCSNYRVGNTWFAEYHDGATFGWHTHEGCNLSAVIQLVLDDPANGTQLREPFDVDLKEGDLVIFPAMMPHQSPVVSAGNKIVVGINFDMI